MVRHTLKILCLAILGHYALKGLTFKINCFLTVFLNNDRGETSHLVALFRDCIRKHE